MRKIAFLTILTALIMTSCCNQSQKEKAAIAKLDTMFQELYPADEPGAAVLILKGDKIVYDKGFGIADLETGAKIDGNTFFNIASVSKQFTAVAMLQLAEQGKISLQDPVKKYFPEFQADFFNDITIAHLLSHTSGIGDYRPREDRDFVLYATDEQCYKYMETLDKLHFTPGTEYQYMNPTFQLCYIIIQRVTGQSFEQYMKDNIFTPAGMDQTVYFSPDKNIPNMSHAYIPVEEKESASNTDSDRTPEAQAAAKKQQESAPVIGNWKEYDYGQETFFATKADGGIYTSTHQFVQWEKALRNAVVASAESIKNAHTPKIQVSGSKFSSYQNRPHTHYGYGWFIENDPEFTERIYHTGDNGGYQIYAGRYPASDLLILIFANRTDYDRWTNVQKVDAIAQEAGWLK